MKNKWVGSLVAVLCACAFITVAGCGGDDDGGGSDNESADTTEFVGNWSGTYAGGESGTWSCTVDASGAINGFTSGPNGRFTLVGSVTSDGNFTATAGNVTTGASFAGQMTGAGAVNGTWQNSTFGLRGTFTGTRQ